LTISYLLTRAPGGASLALHWLPVALLLIGIYWMAEVSPAAYEQASAPSESELKRHSSARKAVVDLYAVAELLKSTTISLALGFHVHRIDLPQTLVPGHRHDQRELGLGSPGH